MFVCEISSEANKFSIAWHLLIKKQSHVEYFLKIFNIRILILVKKKVLAEVLAEFALTLTHNCYYVEPFIVCN